MGLPARLNRALPVRGVGTMMGFMARKRCEEKNNKSSRLCAMVRRVKTCFGLLVELVG